MEQKNRTKTKAERTLPSFHGLPPSCLPLKGSCLPPPTPNTQFFLSGYVPTRPVQRPNLQTGAIVQSGWLKRRRGLGSAAVPHHMTRKRTVRAQGINTPAEHSALAEEEEEVVVESRAGV